MCTRVKWRPQIGQSVSVLIPAIITSPAIEGTVSQISWGSGPATVVVGDIITGAYANQLRDLLNETAPAKVTTAGDLVVGVGANSIARMLSARSASGVGATTTVQAVGAQSGGSNLNGGDLILAAGTATGSGDANIYFRVPTAGGSGTTDRAPANRWAVIGNGGLFGAATDNTVDIGASNNYRPATVYVAAGVAIGATPASGGPIRLTTGQYITWRNNANTFDVNGWTSNAADQMQTTATVVPLLDNALDLGTSAVKWRDVYCNRAAFNGSSRTLKRDLTPVDPTAALDAVRATEVVRFRYKPTDDRDAGAEAWQVGFVAEDAPDLLSPDHAHASAATTASVTLAALQALAAEVADLKAQLAAALAGRPLGQEGA